LGNGEEASPINLNNRGQVVDLENSFAGGPLIDGFKLAPSEVWSFQQKLFVHVRAESKIFRKDGVSLSVGWCRAVPEPA
jgi:hypothetical protein